VTPFVGRAARPAASLGSHCASEAAGLAAAVIAVVAFAGWWAGLPLLSAWGVSSATVKPPVALCLAALGLALVHPGRNWRLAFAAGIAVAAVAALRLGLAVLGLDGWLAELEAAAALQIPKAALLPLGLTGGALALGRFEPYRFAATALAVLAGAIAVFGLLGYLTGIDRLYGSTSVRLPPLPTAVALLCIVCGIVLRIGTMPVIRTPRPLWPLLLALGCATAAPLLLFGAYAGSRMAEAQLEQVRKDLLNEARIVSAEIDRQIVAEIEKLKGLAASPSLRQGDFAAFQRQAEAALSVRHSGNIMLIDRDMKQLVNTWLPFGTWLPRAVVQEPVEQALATGRPQFTGLFMGPVSRQLLFAIIVPVEIDGENRYALVRSPNRQAFGDLVAERELPPGWQAVVTDASHRVLARSGQVDGVIGAALPQAQWHQGSSSGVFRFAGPDGQPSLQAYAHSQLTGWETAVWEPQALLEAPVRALWQALGWLALMAFALVAALALWLGRLIAGAVGHAAGAAAALGEGAPLPAGGTPVAEVNTLMAQLHEAAAGREAMDHRLRESETTFRTMFDMSSVAKIEVVPGNGRFLRANAAMCKFVGYTESELLDMTVWDITHPDECVRDLQPIRRLLSGEASEFDVEKRYIRKDGTPVWAHTTVNVIRDEQGHPVRDFAVIQDIDARKRAEQELQASKDRLELALDAARLGSWQYDAARRIFTGDARSKEIFNVDISEAEVPIDDIFKRLHPDDVEKVSKEIAEALDPVDPKRAVNQFRLQGQHGETRWVETLGQGYFERTGPERRGVCIVGTCQDITERKEREEKEHLLMREINHRAKNMLSVVHAIAHQTATKNPEDFIARFSERIQALSANQDLLVRNEWNGVEAADLVHAQLAPFIGLIGSRIAVHGPRVRLTASSAQAVGLALHELATNAGKYGALSNDRGRVDITWDVSMSDASNSDARTRDASGDTFTMSWRESGGPPVSLPKRRGFGSIVMDVMAGRSLGGRVDLDYAPPGVTWRLTCPAANALESREPEPREPEPAKSSPDGSSAEKNRAGGEDGIREGETRQGETREDGTKVTETREDASNTATGSIVPFARPSAEEEPGGRAPHPPQFNTELRGR
jgi:PAS domain S-box-containing protein